MQYNEEHHKESYTFNASLEVLEKLRGIIGEAGSKNGFDKKHTYRLSLAIDEIATNIIKHGYLENNLQNQTFAMDIEVNDNQIQVSLIDEAPAYNPLEQKPPTEEELSLPLEDRPIGGLGVMIAKQNVDEFKYDYKENKNINKLVVLKNKE